jgi:hypothetical protein
MYDNEKDELTVEERAERDRLIALARRQADLAAKNPITHPWKKFEAKINPELGGQEDYVEKREEKVERTRENRQHDRKHRKKGRKHDDDLKLRDTTLYG